MTLRAPRKPEFHRFSELTHANVNRDFQVHTNWTDGEGTISEVLERARQVRLAEIAFTEHARASSDYYIDFFLEIEEHAGGVPQLSVYRGFEVKVIDETGALDMSDEMGDTADLILGSVHTFRHSDGRSGQASNFAEEEAWALEFDLARGIIEGGGADILSHAGGMCLRTFGRFPEDYLDRLIEVAADRNVVFEINISYHATILDQLKRSLVRHDPLVSIGSDAHRLEEIGTCRDAVRGAFGL